jgi:S-adenosylmethionine hydrolase
MKPIITFLTDFGLEDEWVGTCHGVILKILPEAEIIDVTHQIPSFDIRKGAFVLVSSLPFMPQGVHLAVVDPGVGTERRAIIVETGRGDFLVGPDNGLLVPAVQRLGEVRRVVQISNDEYFLKPVSSTFHARDVFSPVSAYLAKGIEMTSFGPLLDPTTLVSAPWSPAVVKENEVEADIIDIDKFGTLRLNSLASDVGKIGISRGDWVRIKWGSRHRDVPMVETFTAVESGKPMLLVDSSGYVSIAVSLGRADTEFDLKMGEKIRFEKIRDTVIK